MRSKIILGIDFGGSGIKGAPVDIKKGKLTKERLRIPTPDNSTPEEIVKIIKELLKHFKWKKPIGLAFPAIVQKGIVRSAANIDKSWIGVNAYDYLSKKLGVDVYVVNDADAAGYAEIKHGIGKDKKGSVIMLTIGTGIGTAFFANGQLLPNTELGHIIFKGEDAEKQVSDATRKKEGLKWKEWAPRFDDYLLYLEQLFNPDLFIIGGGASKKEHKFADKLTIKTPVKMAELRNDAGIIGAAMFAYDMMK